MGRVVAGADVVDNGGTTAARGRSTVGGAARDVSATLAVDDEADADDADGTRATADGAGGVARGGTTSGGGALFLAVDDGVSTCDGGRRGTSTSRSVDGTVDRCAGAGEGVDGEGDRCAGAGAAATGGRDVSAALAGADSAGDGTSAGLFGSEAGRSGAGNCPGTEGRAAADDGRVAATCAAGRGVSGGARI